MPSFLPGNERIPGVYQDFNLERDAGLVAGARRVLLIGYRSTGTSADSDLTPRRVRTRSEVQTLSGVGSVADLMARAAFRCAPLALADEEPGSLPEVWVMNVAPPAEVGDVAAEFTLTVTGPATSNGRLRLYVGSESLEFGVLAGDSADTIASAVKAALDTAAPELHYTAAVTTNVVTLTAREKGAHGNGLVAWADTSEIAGATIAVAQTATGAGVVDLDPALDAALLASYNAVVIPQDDTTTRDALRTKIIEAWGPDNQQRRILAVGIEGDFSDAETYGAAVDDYRVQVVCAEKIAGVGKPFDETQSSRSLAFEVAAAEATRIHTHDRPNWNYNLASLPVYGRPRKGISRSAIRDAINAGVTVVMAPERGNFPGQIVDPISCAVTDQTVAPGTGEPDTRWQPIEIAKVVAAVAENMDRELAKFPQLAADEDTRLAAKAAGVAVLTQAATEGWIQAPTRNSVEATYETVGATRRLVVDLAYTVITGLDLVEVSHAVRRD